MERPIRCRANVAYPLVRVGLALGLCGACATPAIAQVAVDLCPAVAQPTDNAALARIVHDDQQDRTGEEHAGMAARDSARLTQTVHLYHADSLITQCAAVQATLLAKSATKQDTAAISTRLWRLAFLPTVTPLDEQTVDSGLRTAVQQAGLTVRQFLSAYRSLWTAVVATAIQADVESASTNGRNIALVQAHQQEMHTLHLEMTTEQR